MIVLELVPGALRQGPVAILPPPVRAWVLLVTEPRALAGPLSKDQVVSQPVRLRIRTGELGPLASIMWPQSPAVVSSPGHILIIG